MVINIINALSDNTNGARIKFSTDSKSLEVAELNSFKRDIRNKKKFTPKARHFTRLVRYFQYRFLNVNLSMHFA